MRPFLSGLALLALLPALAQGQQSRPAAPKTKAKAAPAKAKPTKGEELRVVYQYRRRVTTLAEGKVEPGPDAGGVVTIDLTEDKDKADRFAVAIEIVPFEGPTMSEVGALIRGPDGWKGPEDLKATEKRAMEGMATIMNLGRRLRALFPKELDSARPNPPTSVPFERLSGAIKLLQQFQALKDDTPSELRCLGTRSIDGVPCLALTFTATQRNPEVAEQQEGSGRLSGLILVEEKTGQARLANFTHKQRMTYTDSNTGQRRTQVIATRFRMRFVPKAKPAKKP